MSRLNTNQKTPLAHPSPAPVREISFRATRTPRVLRSRGAIRQKQSSKTRCKTPAVWRRCGRLFMSTSRPAERTRIPGPLLIVILLLAISVFINYIDRGNLSIAAPMLKDELGISAAQLGVLLSAFFWTYACLHLFYG